MSCNHMYQSVISSVLTKLKKCLKNFPIEFHQINLCDDDLCVNVAWLCLDS